MSTPPELSALHVLDPKKADLTANQRAKLKSEPARWLIAVPR